jgi:hypothetical protein
MATNTGDGTRTGSVKSRSQVKNPNDGKFVKRSLESGQFMDRKEDGEPFKGVAKEVDRRRS